MRRGGVGEEKGEGRTGGRRNGGVGKGRQVWWGKKGGEGRARGEQDGEKYKEEWRRRGR